MSEEQKNNAVDQLDPPAGVVEQPTENQLSGRPREEAGQQPPGQTLPIVALCASAGGIEALQQFFTYMPAGSGMAFVVAIHLSPHYESTLPDLLQNFTAMPVAQIEDGVSLQPNRVYVIPPDREIGLLHGTLQLMKRITQAGWPLTIDVFLESLADDQDGRAICVILSGAGTDGTLGSRAIKEKGGLVVVQDPETAGAEGMPNSAISTGVVDYVLPVSEMPQKIIDYTRRAIFRQAAGHLETRSLPADGLNKIFMLLRSHTGHDFTYYKHTTINRRVARRMMLNQVDTLADYVNFLRRNPEEANSLFKELLIGVTHFFRDPQAFAVLEKEVLPELFSNREPGVPMRVWVPGCATGEEAYSLAMLLREYKQAGGSHVEIQLFATDVDGEVIDYARRGIYPASIAQHVAPERLKRFFIEGDHVYEVRKELREMIVFAEQNVIQDPPFSRLDLISCRNLLIYLEAELQKSVLALFHYALGHGGYLFLGPSESVGDFAPVFTVVDRKWRLFQKTGEDVSHWPGVAFFAPRLPDRPTTAPGGRPRQLDHRELVRQLLLEHYSAACAIINEHHRLFYTLGPVDRYLRLPPGEMSMSILDMAREGLALDLMTAIHHATAHGETAVHSSIRVKTNGGAEIINLIVKPISEPPAPAGLLMIIFEKAAPAPAKDTVVAGAVVAAAEEDDARIATLQRELASTRRYLQTALEEMQTAYEELKSTNEEMQSANEELQSSNEELKTSKEELQSVNEELATVNMDFQSKNEELIRANNDLHNLLRATRIATLFLDDRLRIKGFTPAVMEIVNVIQSDVGRPLKHIATNLRYATLVPDAERVLDTLATEEKEVQTTTGRWYSVRIMPYRTVENVIEGLTIVFNPITEQKQAQFEINQALDFAQNIVDTVHEALLVLDADLTVVQANRRFYDTFQVPPAETESQRIYNLSDRQWDIPELRRLLEEIIPENTTFEGYQIEHNFPRIGRRLMRLNARMIQSGEEGGEPLILLAIDDVT